MARFCVNCGIQLDDAVKFCASCGAQQQPTPAQQQPASVQAAQPQQPPQEQPYIPPQQPPARKTYLKGALSYFGWISIMTLPLAGLVVSILLGRSKTPSDRRSLARAMITVSAVWLIVCVTLIITLNLLSQVCGLIDIHLKIFGITLF